MKRQLISAALTITLAACGVGTQHQSEEAGSLQGSQQELKTRVTPVTYGMQTAPSHTPGVTPAWTGTFPLSSTREIWIAFEINGTFSGHHTERLQINQPNGYVYEVVTVNFAAGVSPYSGEQVAEQTSTGYIVWYALPVAGTWIYTSHVTGTWSADAFLDSSASANSFAAFNIQ